MNIVILTRDDQEHIYVANQICRHFKISRILVDKGVKRSKTSTIRMYFKKYKFNIVQLVIRKIINTVIHDSRRRQQALLDVFGDDGTAFIELDKVQYVKGANSKQSEEILTDLQPDVLVIYGTSIIKDHILNLAKQKALNMHTGKSPYYRGSACSFWPLYNDQLGYLGATVHECCSRIDGGEIYGVVSAKIEHDDNMHTVFARCVVAGADEYIATIHEILNGTLQGSPQDLTQGKEYRATDKTWRHECKVRKKIKQGLIRNYVNTS